ncbi:MAG: response regulator [Gemmatimonadaceae bacterium]|nr:response regulator [Gemmatimonadaceae bacterium]
MKATRDILVIDDEDVISQAVQRVCSAEGLTVDIASSATVGLARMTQVAYRLVVCDVMMADVDGFGFLAELARRQDHTPVIMSTGMSTMENAVKALNAGAVDFVPKPFTVDELLTAVRRGLKYKALLDEAKTAAQDARPDTIAWVPPPAQYYRLGYASWLATERSGTVQVGITDLFLRTLDAVQGVELAAVGDELVQGSSCATLRAVDGSEHGVLCPVTGRVVEINETLGSAPAVMERDPYFGGWLYRVLPSELQYDLKHLTSCSSDRM